MKKLVFKTLLIISIVIVAVATYLYFANKDKEPDVYISHEMVVHEIVQLGRLEVVKYNTRDIIEYKKVRQWLPNSKAALIVVGEVIGCIDLTKLDEKDIVVTGDSVSILLPDPEICSFKVDHEKSKVHNVENGWWETTEIIDEAYRHAEKQLRNQAQQMGLKKDSRANAEKLLRPLLGALGFKAINIDFKEDVDDSKLYGRD